MAVHGNKSPAPEKALDVVRELYHVLYWMGRTYLRKGAESLRGKTFDESLVPTVDPATTPASVQELQALKAQRDAAAEARKEIESELEAVRERLAAIKAENGVSPRPTTGTRTRPARSSSISIWSAPVGRWTGNRTVNTQ